jgi:hypothetical protein
MMSGSWFRSVSSPPSSAFKSAGMRANAVAVRSSGHTSSSCPTPVEYVGESKASGRDAALGSFRWGITLDDILDLARRRGEDERLGNLKGRFQRRSRGTSERSEESDHVWWADDEGK